MRARSGWMSGSCRLCAPAPISPAGNDRLRPQATGLRPGTPVIAGTGDTFPTIVGCGAIDAGDAMISFGTTGLLTLTTRPLETAAAGPHFRGAAEGGAVEWAANVLACGRLLAWYREASGLLLSGRAHPPRDLPISPVSIARRGDPGGQRRAGERCRT